MFFNVYFDLERTDLQFSICLSCAVHYLETRKQMVILEKEMQKNKVSVLDVSEARWTGHDGIKNGE
jgi:hypothetical protein